MVKEKKVEAADQAAIDKAQQNQDTPPEHKGLPVRAVAVPDLSNYYSKGDESVGFRAALSPYKIRLIKAGDRGTINLEKKTYPVVPFQDKITAVFLGVFSDKLTKRPFTTCNCNKYKMNADGSKSTNEQSEGVCFSADRTYALKGFKCSECPFPRDDIANKVTYRKSLTQEMLFLVRDPNKPEWYLASYTAKIDTIKALNGGIFRKVHDEMSGKHGNKLGTEAIVELRVNKQKIEGTQIMIINFTEYAIQACLNEDSYKKIRAFADEVMKIKADIVAGYHALGAQKYKDRLETGMTSVIDTQVVMTDPDSAHPEEELPKVNVSDARPAEVHPAADPDDDIPF